MIYTRFGSAVSFSAVRMTSGLGLGAELQTQAILVYAEDAPDGSYKAGDQVAGAEWFDITELKADGGWGEIIDTFTRQVLNWLTNSEQTADKMMTAKNVVGIDVAAVIDSLDVGGMTPPNAEKVLALKGLISEAREYEGKMLSVGADDAFDGLKTMIDCGRQFAEDWANDDEDAAADAQARMDVAAEWLREHFPAMMANPERSDHAEDSSPASQASTG